MKLEKYIQKLCCFYASDWHLTVMLLPYINSKIKNSSIYMKCENNIEEKMKLLLDKLEIKNKRDIMSINWNNKKVAEDDNSENEKIYIISGNEEFIKENNNLIENYYKNKIDKIKIINCYEVTNQKNLDKIISENGYTQILNTKGENYITENKAM